MSEDNSNLAVFSLDDTKRIAQAVREVERRKLKRTGGMGNGRGRGSGGDMVWFKLSSDVSGQIGRYNLKTFSGGIDDSASGNLAEADLGTVSSTEDAIGWCVPEILAAPHLNMLKSGGVYVGRKAGRTSAGKPIILFSPLPVGKTASATTLDGTGGGTTADTTTWSRSSDGTPVTEVYASRPPVWDGTAKILYGFYRTRTIDACGLTISISAETRVTIDTLTSC